MFTVHTHHISWMVFGCFLGPESLSKLAGTGGWLAVRCDGSQPKLKPRWASSWTDRSEDGFQPFPAIGPGKNPGSFGLLQLEKPWVWKRCFGKDVFGKDVLFGVGKRVLGFQGQLEKMFLGLENMLILLYQAFETMFVS